MLETSVHFGLSEHIWTEQCIQMCHNELMTTKYKYFNFSSTI